MKKLFFNEHTRMKNFLFNLFFPTGNGSNSGSSLVRFFIFLPFLAPLGALFHNFKTFLKTIVFSAIFIFLQFFYLFVDYLFGISEKTYFNFWWFYAILMVANVIYIIKNWKNEDNLIAGWCTLFTWAPIVFIVIFFFAAAMIH